MPSSITVNLMTTQHKISVGITSAFPDVCKTPAPPAPSPVPIPYPNVGLSGMASIKVTKRVGDDTGQKVMLMGSSYSLTSGDEPGIALGIISNRVKGKSTTKNSSFNVKFEGKGVSRLTDPHGNNSGSTPNTVAPAEMQGPTVGIDTTALGEDQRKACDKLAEKEVPKKPGPPGTHAEVAEQAGMLKQDYDAIRNTCKRNNVMVSFRDTNKACLPHLAKGVPSKGHDVMTKTFDASNLRPGQEKYAGLVSNYSAKPPKGQLILDAKSDLVLRKGKPLTGDYDMNDMFDGKTGQRIGGGGSKDRTRENKLIKRFNDAIPGDQPRVMHGAQANFGDFARSSEGAKEFANKAPPKGLMQAGIDPGKGEGLTVFDGKSRKVYRLETHEDVVNMYRCQGAELPPEWDYRDKVSGEKIKAKV